jgi:hypothetical protein
MPSSTSLEDVEANACEEVRFWLLERLKRLPTASRHVKVRAYNDIASHTPTRHALPYMNLQHTFTHRIT